MNPAARQQTTRAVTTDAARPPPSPCASFLGRTGHLQLHTIPRQPESSLAERRGRESLGEPLAATSLTPILPHSWPLPRCVTPPHRPLGSCLPSTLLSSRSLPLLTTFPFSCSALVRRTDDGDRPQRHRAGGPPRGIQQQPLPVPAEPGQLRGNGLAAETQRAGVPGALARLRRPRRAAPAEGERRRVPPAGAPRAARRRRGVSRRRRAAPRLLPRRRRHPPRACGLLLLQ
jgi:hypothetical protein